MTKRLPYLALALATFLAWWLGQGPLLTWFQDVGGYHRMQDHDLQVLLGNWVFEPLLQTGFLVLVWIAGTRFGVMPSFRGALSSGGSWRRVIRQGLIASVILVGLTLIVGPLAGGKFGFHPYFPKMAGDLLSNLYEEIAYRGMIFSVCYGLVAAAPFPLTGPTDRTAAIVGAVVSSALFGAGHTQYGLALRIYIGVFSVFFVYPWVRSRSLWAPWIPHMLVDIIGDTVLTL